jgi:hypothetical protein
MKFVRCFDISLHRSVMTRSGFCSSQQKVMTSIENDCSCYPNIGTEKKGDAVALHSDISYSCLQTYWKIAIYGNIDVGPHYL